MKNTFLKFGSRISTLPILFLPSVAGAETFEGLTDTSQLASVATAAGTDVTSATLPEIIGNIIQVLLSVLGIVFVILIVYAGFMYLTARGEAGKTEKAVKMLSQATIGLVLIVAAYAIANFVIDALVEVSGQ